MKKSLVNICTEPLAQIISTALVVFGTFLTVTALMAQPSPKARPRTKACTDWPLAKDQKKVEAAFDKVLKDSATDSTLRSELLNVSDCYKNPKAAVQRTLDAMPGDQVKIPDEVVIIFYENDSPRAKRLGRPFADYPSDHCLHIFFLPDAGAQVSSKTSFRENLMCCYKPWGPPPPPGP